MAFLSEEVIKDLGFKSIGKNVKISDKASIYNHDLIAIGDNSRIDDFCVLSGNVQIGRNVHIAVFCNVAGGDEGVVLEDFSGLAYGVHVFSQSDDYSGKTLTNPTVPDRFKKEIKKRTVIGRHVIVGTNSIVFPGANLAEGTSVGAQSIMNKPSEPWSIYLGCPAKKIRNRDKGLLELENEYLKRGA